MSIINDKHSLISIKGNLISKSGNNYLTLSYDKLVPVLVEGIKELNNKNKYLEYELSNIKYKLNI